MSGTALDSTPERWRQFAGALEQFEVESDRDDSEGCTNALVQLVIDTDHEALLRSALANAQERLIVVSHRLGQAAQPRLIAATHNTRGAGFRFLVIYGQKDITDEPALELEQVVEDAGGIMLQCPGMHAKIIVSDSTVCIGSYNFLSTDVYDTSSRTKELSIIIDGDAPRGWVEQRLGKVTGRDVAGKP